MFFASHTGCIDGYSRLVVFMDVATNNKAETVSNLFTQAAQSYGYPSRVRTDKGGNMS